MQGIRRVRRVLGDLAKTLAGIVAYLGVTGTIAFASLHVIVIAGDLKCEICRDPALLLVAGPHWTSAERLAPDPAARDIALRGTFVPK